MNVLCLGGRVMGIEVAWITRKPSLQRTLAVPSATGGAHQGGAARRFGDLVEWMETKRPCDPSG